MTKSNALIPSPRSPDPTQRFSDRVDDYVRYRPTYPVAMFDALAASYGLSAKREIADLGSGTGILTQLLLERGHTVYAVEPNEAMRAAAEARLARFTGFCSLATTAEATGLADGSVDWVMAAQAFHWFDVDAARAECRRVLHAGRGCGFAALLWNNRREDTPFLADYEAFLHEYGIDYARVKHQNAQDDGRIARFFGDARVALHTFANVQPADFDGLVGRTTSCSYMPSRQHERYPAMLARLRELFAAHQSSGGVAFEYETRVYVGRMA
ncbi:MAG: class I SAM-dependent methyltransferase [Phycisphaerales bacterium]|nr:class I SAM-dependent methyltransferase [Phycisphaerales bacterium]